MNDTIIGAVLVTDNDAKMSMIYDLNVNGKQPNKIINLSYLTQCIYYLLIKTIYYLKGETGYA